MKTPGRGEHPPSAAVPPAAAALPRPGPVSVRDGKSPGSWKEEPMGLFSGPKVPNTVSDRKRAELNRRAARQDWLSKKAAERRKAAERQRKKSAWS